MRVLLSVLFIFLLGGQTLSGQCPDYAAINSSQTCIGVAWLGGDPPEPLPNGLFVVEAPYIYLTGGGTSVIDLAIYTLNGEIMNPLECGLSFNLFTGTLSFQDFSCTYVNGVLPVTLTAFNATRKNQLVELTWSTSFEYQNKEFIVQRSTDGYFWDDLGTVVGAGSTDANMEYAFIDNFPEDGRNYYRLEQIDFDGQSELSEIVTLSFQSELFAFPNPVHDILTIRGQFELFTISGQLMDAGENANLDVSHLPDGMYIVRQGSRAQRIVKY